MNMNTVTGNIDIVKVSMKLVIISTHYTSYAKIKSVWFTKHFSNYRLCLLMLSIRQNVVLCVYL